MDEISYALSVGGLYLYWVGITIISMNRDMRTEGDRSRSADSMDLSMPTLYNNNSSSSTDAIETELLNQQVCCCGSAFHRMYGHSSLPYHSMRRSQPSHRVACPAFFCVWCRDCFGYLSSCSTSFQ